MLLGSERCEGTTDEVSSSKFSEQALKHLENIFYEELLTVVTHNQPKVRRNLTLLGIIITPYIIIKTTLLSPKSTPSGRYRGPLHV